MERNISIESFCRGIVSWKENMSNIERRNLCSALIYPEGGGNRERELRCTPINRRIHRNRLKPKVLPSVTDNRTLNWIFFLEVDKRLTIRDKKLSTWMKTWKRTFERSWRGISVFGLILVGRSVGVLDRCLVVWCHWKETVVL